MITVKTPDGGVAQFPDGTDPNVIKQALAKKFAPDKALAPNMLAAKLGVPPVVVRERPEDFVLLSPAKSRNSRVAVAIGWRYSLHHFVAF